jgi:uncharacterized surface anchored protein
MNFQRKSAPVMARRPLRRARTPLLLLLALAAAVVLLPCAAAVRPQSRGRGQIQGVVTFEGRPVRKALVLATSADAGQRAGVADENGFFSIGDLNDGAYVVTVSHPVYVAADESDPAAGNKLVEVKGGDRVEQNFSLTRGGVITGRVRDTAGQPAVGQRVVYEKAAPGAAFSPMSFRTDVLTDDQGRFRIYGLPPGQYRVGVGGQSGDLGKLPSPFSPAYYAASPVRLAPGQQLDLGELEVRAAGRGFSAEITFVDEEGGEPLAGLEFDLLRVGESGAVVRTAFRADARGVARIENLAPARYRVSPAVKNSGARGARGFSPVFFDIEDESVGGITVKCDSATASLAGEVRIGGRTPANASDCTLALKEGEDLAAPGRPAYAVKLDAAGRFRVTGLREGVYTLVVLPLKPSLRYESATLDGQVVGVPNVFGALRLDLGPGPRTVTINLGESRR